jgi:hypothetical protein
MWGKKLQNVIEEEGRSSLGRLRKKGSFKPRVSRPAWAT